MCYFVVNDYAFSGLAPLNTCELVDTVMTKIACVYIYSTVI